MSKQANKTAIGVFVVGAVVLAVAAIIAFGSGKFFVKTDMYVAYFPGSVKGLRIGAPVMFRGVKIGEVTQIRIYSIAKDMSIEIPVIFKEDPGSINSIGAAVEAYFSCDKPRRRPVQTKDPIPHPSWGRSSFVRLAPAIRFFIRGCADADSENCRDPD